MPDLSFEVVGAESPDFAAVPTLNFKLKITNTNAQEYIQTVALRCQLQIAATWRNYSVAAQTELRDVFDEPKRWGQTLKNLLWMHISIVVPAFTGSTIVDLPVPCSYDFEVVSTKYFNAIDTGDIPLLFLFSGTVFYEGEDENLQIGQIPWSKEATYRLPVTLWQEMMAHYYPNSAWLHLHKDVFDKLYRYKAIHSLPTWEETLEQLLQRDSEEAKL